LYKCEKQISASSRLSVSMSIHIRPSVHTEQLGSHCAGSHKMLYYQFLLKPVMKI